ncbi:MAG TPA: peroxidase [Chloroflexia bacterium]|nr:peroxidase [Chloroflexia bacterium]
MTLELEDIQGLLVRGYGNLKAACYLLLAINDPVATRAWLNSIALHLTGGTTKPESEALNLALTASGLARLGLDDTILSQFAAEFTAGMADPVRSRVLGDIGESSPANWQWGGPATQPVDLLLLLFASDAVTLEAAYQRYAQDFATGGLIEIKKLDTGELSEREHFGFRDGISQPVIEGLPLSESPMNIIKPGEFILGYPNEYNLYTERPLLPSSADPQKVLPNAPEDKKQVDLGRNGTYLVFRQLSQDVSGFWRFMDRATRRPDGSADMAARVKLAARMVGRWPGGAPLLKSPDRDDPALSEENNFSYYNEDARGHKCPIGAHIRRSHPRDSLDPQPGTDKSIEIDKRHRILRRGRSYGAPLPVQEWIAADGPVDAPDDAMERGLHFLALCGNISRQFEFIQHTWVNNPRFDGLYDDADPLLGTRGPDGGIFTIQGSPVRQRVKGIPPFVTVRGGAYFFLPGLKAVRYLASLTPGTIPATVNEAATA